MLLVSSATKTDLHIPQAVNETSEYFKRLSNKHIANDKSFFKHIS